MIVHIVARRAASKISSRSLRVCTEYPFSGTALRRDFNSSWAASVALDTTASQAVPWIYAVNPSRVCNSFTAIVHLFSDIQNCGNPSKKISVEYDIPYLLPFIGVKNMLYLMLKSLIRWSCICLKYDFHHLYHFCLLSIRIYRQIIFYNALSIVYST